MNSSSVSHPKGKRDQTREVISRDRLKPKPNKPSQFLGPAMVAFPNK